MKDEKTPWSKAAVFICTKCGKSISGASSELADKLKKEWKSELKERGLGKDIRVMTSGCLDICESGFQAIAIMPTEGHGSPRIKVIDPAKEKDSFFKELTKL